MKSDVASAALTHDEERRSQPRHRLCADGHFRERGRTKAIAQVTELSSAGCRIRMEGEVISGEHGWVTLPSLGPWACSVAWQSEKEIGLAFERALHPSVSEMLADRHG